MKLKNFDYTTCESDGQNKVWNKERSDNVICTLLECPYCREKLHLNSSIYLGKMLTCSVCNKKCSIMGIDLELKKWT